MTVVGPSLSRDSKKPLEVRSSVRKAILSRMGKMVRNEGTIRPRKNTNWPSDSFKPKKVPIFKVDENDLPGDMPSANLRNLKDVLSLDQLITVYYGEVYSRLKYGIIFWGSSTMAPKVFVWQIKYYGILRGYNYYANHTPATKKATAPPEKPSEIKKSLLNQLEKYCENTTLHGLRYVGDSQLTFGERIFWFISFSLAIGFAAYYISNIYTKWKSSPVIISFSPFDADLSSIPFPAVTICNMNQAKKSEAVKILKDGSIIEKKLLDDSCNGNATFNNSENIDWESLRDFLIRVGNSCSDILKWCQWGSEIINCDDIFNNDLTDEGLCCSFNRLPPEKIFRNWKDVSILNQTYPSNVYDWDAEKGFEDADTGDSIPKRPLGAGAHLGLSVVLDAQVDNYYCSSTRSTGFKVILSNPIETPKMADFGFLVSPGFETRIAIEPSVREATTSLRDVPIEKRQCYFANERPLQYYRKYSRSNCLLECQSNYFLEKCGCIPHYLPKKNSTIICAKNDRCTSGTLELIDKLDGRFKQITRESIDCNCLTLCFKVSYFFSITNSPLTLFRKTNYTEKFIRNNLAKAVIYFDSTTYSKIRKMPLYNFTDLMAYTGGLLGLFIGFSFLSVVEVIFHMFWLSWKEYVLIKYGKKVNGQENRVATPPYPFVN